MGQADNNAVLKINMSRLNMAHLSRAIVCVTYRSSVVDERTQTAGGMVWQVPSWNICVKVDSHKIYGSNIS